MNRNGWQDGSVPVKTLALKPEDLILTPGTHVKVERETKVHDVLHLYTHPTNNNNDNNNNNNK